MQASSTSVWTPENWKSLPAHQQPTYDDPEAVAAVLSELSTLPPLVTSWEVDRLRQQVADAQAGDAWILQGGDCAESFDECRASNIASKLKVLLQMSLVLVLGSKKKIIRLGRIAGQYAKPRSKDTETQGEVSLPSYRGDLINSAPFTPDDRRNDPKRLLQGYARSAQTMNYIRGLSEGGFADLHHPENWNLDFVHGSDTAQRFQQIVSSLGDTLEFINAISDSPLREMERVDFFISHEALHLLYESALTRRSIRDSGWYNLSTHFPWIGERTRQLDGAHVELLRGVRNPVGVKVGPSADPQEIVELVRRLNADNEPGKVTLIHRLGNANAEGALPELIETIQRAEQRVLWVCDPMHGNTVSVESGKKTRRFEDVLGEIKTSFAVHRACGSYLGGVHLELTGENVTECVGGSAGLTEADLETAYNTNCDPRLNYAQAMEIAFSIASEIGS